MRAEVTGFMLEIYVFYMYELYHVCRAAFLPAGERSYWKRPIRREKHEYIQQRTQAEIRSNKQDITQR